MNWTWERNRRAGEIQNPAWTSFSSVIELADSVCRPPSIFSTYLARTSTSKLTGSPG